MWWPFSKKDPIDDSIINLVKNIKASLVQEYCQEIVGSLENKSNELFKEFRYRAASRCWRLSQKWCQWGDEKPILQPHQSRLFYRKGDTDIMLVEETPQLRNLRFGKADKEIKTYNLALPYVIFIFRFISGVFKDVYCCFNDKPITDLSECPKKPYLPNIDGNLKCCLGKSFNLPSNLNYSQIVSYTVNYFWNAVNLHEGYNWDSNWVENKTHFENSDGRLATLEDWEDASKQNPLFVVDNVQWVSHNTSIGEIIVNLVLNDNKVRQFEDAMFKDLVDSLLQNVSKDLLSSIKEASEKVKSQDNEVVKSRLIKAIRKSKLLEKLDV